MSLKALARIAHITNEQRQEFKMTKIVICLAALAVLTSVTPALAQVIEREIVVHDGWRAWARWASSRLGPCLARRVPRHRRAENAA